jgi:hypothetical protein
MEGCLYWETHLVPRIYNENQCKSTSNRQKLFKVEMEVRKQDLKTIQSVLFPVQNS